MAATMATIKAMIISSFITLPRGAPVNPKKPGKNFCSSSIMPSGNLAIMPMNIIKDIPLPIPLSVILSPNHIMNMVPEVKVRMVIAIKLERENPCKSREGLVWLARNMAIPMACIAAIRTVP